MNRSIVHLALSLLLLLAAARGVPAAEPGPVAEMRDLALELVNRERTQRGLGTMVIDPALCSAAQAHADDMLSRAYFSHRSPEGDDVLARFTAAGGSRWLSVGENIIHCASCRAAPRLDEVRVMHRNWMDSPPHRGAILDPKYRRFCLGLASERESGYYAVQTFAGPGAPRARGVAGRPEALPPERLRAIALQLINAERRARGRPPLAVSSELSSDAEAYLRSELARDPDGRDGLGGERLRSYLSGHANGAWLQVGALLEACGGCGISPTDGDVAFFARNWLQGGETRETLLDRRFDSFGMALAADGRGRKVLIGLFGDRGG